jgi:hypothetical protein
VTSGDLGRALLIMGVVIAVIGMVVMVAGRVPWIGRLPGDIHVERGHWTFYFPLATSIVISVVLTLIFWRFGRR